MSRYAQQPRVTVVIPTFNRARHLARCLDSLVVQTWRDFEVVVCDDGSTDETADVVRRYTPHLDLTYDYAANWGGPARPRNRGIARSRGEYVAFVDSDDWWTRDKLERSLEALDRGADVVYHDLFLVTHDDQRTFWRRARARTVRAPVYDDLLEHGNAIPLSSVVVRRSLLAAIGGMPEDRSLVAIEDFTCWLNAARVTDRFTRIPKVLGYYWAGGGNISGDDRMIRLLDAFEAKYVRGDGGHGRPVPAWLTYARGRAFYRMGDYAAAREQFAALGWGDMPGFGIAKIAWMRLALSVAPRNSRPS